MDTVGEYYHTIFQLYQKELFPFAAVDDKYV